MLPSHAMADPDDDTAMSTATSAPATSGAPTTSSAPAPATSYNPYASSSSAAPKPSADDQDNATPTAEPGNEDEDNAAPSTSTSPAAPASSGSAVPETSAAPKPTNPAQVKAAACTFSREVTAQVAKDTKQFNDLAATENASWSDDDLAAAGETARAGYQTALDKIRSTVPTSGYPSDITAALTDLAHAADDWIYLIDNQNGDMIQGAISEYNDAVGRLRTACQ